MSKKAAFNPNFAPKEKGVTLLELAIVTIIVGLLTSVASIYYFNAIERFYAQEGGQILINLFGSQKRYALENNGAYATDLNDLDIQVRASAYFDPPTVANNPDDIAKITRTDSYYLQIDEDANITCAQNMGPAGICTKLGYRP
ncbi:MAG: type II secretion system protein [Candidatus Omnitrophica bacterium]|nr:type II secretion system protein [Candidatus Omnitrophota bacterium]